MEVKIALYRCKLLSLVIMVTEIVVFVLIKLQQCLCKLKSGVLDSSLMIKNDNFS